MWRATIRAWLMRVREISFTFTNIEFQLQPVSVGLSTIAMCVIDNGRAAMPRCLQLVY